MVVLTWGKGIEIPVEIKELCKNVWQQPLDDTSTPRSSIAEAYELLNSIYYRPLERVLHSVQYLRPELAQLFRDISYDIIWVNRLRIAAFSKHIKGKFRILDFDDVHSVLQKRLAKVKRPRYDPRRYYSLMKAFRIHMLEQKALRAFDRVAVCSEKDRQYHSADNVFVIENCIQIASDIQYTPGRSAHMLYIGPMRYFPNRDAVRYFTRFILPKIRQQLPEAHLTVIGSNPSERLINEAKQAKGVYLTGFVRDIKPYYEDAALSIVPLRIGGGTRIKILESLASKVPVVSTTIGAEGLNLINHEDICIADDPQEFADACIALLKNQNRREKIALSGYRRVLDLYCPERLEKTVEAQITTLIQGVKNSAG